MQANEQSQLRPGSPNKQALMNNISSVLEAWRTARDMTQPQCAAHVGLNCEYYARLERGQALPSVATLYRLATHLGISSDVLLGLSPSSLQGSAASNDQEREVVEAHQSR